jgi:hypothetical protein
MTKTPHTPTAKQQARTAAETAKTGAENTGLAAPSLSQVEKARAEGVTEAIKEQAKDAYNYATDGQLPGDPATTRQFHGHDDIMLWEPNLRLGIEEFEARIAEDHDTPIPEEKVYGLLALERNGQNRTQYVQAMMKRLDLTADQLPGGGPDYTNDVTPVSKLR